MSKEKKEEFKERKLDYTNLYCACDGQRCGGICAAENLFRSRAWSNPQNVCPEAYNKTK